VFPLRDSALSYSKADYLDRALIGNLLIFDAPPSISWILRSAGSSFQACSRDVRLSLSDTLPLCEFLIYTVEFRFLHLAFFVFYPFFLGISRHDDRCQVSWRFAISERTAPAYVNANRKFLPETVQPTGNFFCVPC
jgi:hypothetical protein